LPPFVKITGLLAMLLIVSACASHGGGISRTTPLARPILFSPNGEPLSGGPLKYPSCDDALAGWFTRVDANHDGFIDHNEFMADARVQFDVMDITHDGSLTAAKLAIFRQPYEDNDRGITSADSSPAAGHRSEHPGERPTPSQSRQPYSEPEDPVMSADRTLSFRVTLADFLAAAEENFNHMDSDHRKMLTLANVQNRCHDKP